MEVTSSIFATSRIENDVLWEAWASSYLNGTVNYIFDSSLKTVFSTKAETNPWVQIDLQRTIKILDILVMLDVALPGVSSQTIKIKVSSKPTPIDDQSVCGSGLVDGPVIVIQCLNPIIGRYITILLETETPTSLPVENVVLTAQGIYTHPSKLN
ncbi:uncharacterized protein LOC131882064 [Tigriopus californicus]|uniref:uncharacterized protein LOC131882064 n=1 Tax=Tigriopus californicus TaxID=6832 RepID=UPI0027DA3611|nr:uncharacterized protein LOC131882064 [Tigriopus californicus]